MPHLDVQVPGQTFTEENASVPRACKHLTFNQPLDDGKRVFVFIIGIDGDETGTEVFSRSGQHGVADDSLGHPGHVLFRQSDPAELISALDTMGELGRIQIFRVLEGDVTATESGSQINRIGPVLILHGGKKYSQEHSEHDGGKGQQRAASITPQVAPGHYQQARSFHDALPFLVVAHGLDRTDSCRFQSRVENGKKNHDQQCK